jgi:peptidoglycan hydrolase-like protein with peptidoglycan-binding domain
LAKVGGGGRFIFGKHGHWRYWKRQIALLASLVMVGLAPAYGQAPQDDLRAAQQALQARGYEVGPIDGIIGPQTRSALEAFQRKNSVPISGAADEPTLKALGLQKAPALLRQLLLHRLLLLRPHAELRVSRRRKLQRRLRPARPPPANRRVEAVAA